ncbi:unnamed protein product [Linum trigynum]|uniref:Uncharacterized protein n=1 Tax=Linum trigynum TaxID=586398 RepID=A0AAV2D306_9ROSI
MAYSSGDESILKSAVAGGEWAKQMKEQLEDLEPHQLVPSIFQVPGYLRIWDPKSYTPPLVGLGPFHHFRPQLWDMTAVKRRFVEQGMRRRFNSPEGGGGDDLIENFRTKAVTPLLPAIRAQYDSHLDILDSSLASLVALDSLFLVELLLLLLGGSGDGDHDEAAAYCASILMNDAVMLENQIPLFLLEEPISALLQGWHSDDGEAGLFPAEDELSRVYQHLSPLQFSRLPGDNHPRRHLLECFYFQIVGGGGAVQDQAAATTSFLRILEMAPPGLLNKVESTAVEFNVFDLFYDAFEAAGAKILKRAGMFWLARIALAAIGAIRARLPYDEASIPAASLLARHLDLRILPAEDAVSSSFRAMVSFDEQKRTLRLPVLTLKPNCGTLLRNLVAYEHMTRTDDARVLIGYFKLIAGLTRTLEDMRLLRRAGVIVAGGGDWSALKLFFSQMPPVALDMATLEDLAHADVMAKMAAAEELEAAVNEMKAATMEAGTKLGATAAAKGVASRTALDPQIQALVCCYNREPGVIARNRRLRWMKLGLKIAAVALLIYVAVACVAVITETVYKLVSLDCLYQWPCCPGGLFSALITLVTGGFILNLVRALL